MGLFDDISDGVKKAFLASVGAVAMGAEKSQEVVDELIRKGELTVEQGKAFNEELGRKVKQTTSDASDEVLRTWMRAMSAEERIDWIERAKRIAEELAVEEAEAAEEVVDATYEVVDDAEAETEEPAAEEAEPAVEEPAAEEAEPEAEDLEA